MWNIGNLVKGNSTVLTINARVDLESTLENVAVISGNEYDPILSNNTDSVIVYPSQNAADLGVIKTTSKTEMITGDNVTFNITVTNYGPDTAINAVVFDTLPNGFSYISSNTTIGLYNPSTGIWTIGNLYNGEVETLSIIAQAVKTGTYVNTSVVDSDTYDPNPYNNTSSVTVVVKSKPQPPQPVNGKTVPMQPTGTPALPLVIGLLMLIGGLLGENKWK
ncbi:MAG: hypothetical protein A4E27_00492 [Methanobacterium sp. PtaU1.Bin242]|nr:MAG: hypothetical protein A4E27_00492 [Methanobacterium sp. PtaU1.Bin242]